MNSKRGKLLLLSVAIAKLACVTVDTSQMKGHRRPTVAVLKAKTILPTTFEGQNEELPKRVRVPKTLLTTSRIASKNAEVRLGPASTFPVKDSLLPHRLPVVITEEVGVWRKVFTLKGIEGGWVHYKTLEEPRESPKDLLIAPEDLGVVVTAQAVHSLFTYPEKKQTKVSIPRGASFIALKKSRRNTLIWLPQTNSIAWLANKNLR